MNNNKHNNFKTCRLRLKGKFLTVMHITFLLLSVNTFSQQLPRYSKYLMNEFILNPAVAGVDGLTTFDLTARKEWLGMESGVPTPETYSITAQTRILKRRTSVKSNRSGNKLLKSRDGRIGLGAMVFADYNGAMQRKGIGISYAYHIPIHENQLSFGLTTSITQMQLNSKYLNFKDNNNEVMAGLANSSLWSPDFSAGINFTGRKFHIGFSAVQLLESSIIFGNSAVKLQSSNIHFRRNYFISGAYHNEFASNTDWEYEIATLVKMNDPVKITETYTGTMVQADWMLRFIFDSRIWFGAGYRTSNDFIALAGFKYKSVYFTYSFDYGTNDLMRYSYGSHEISLALKLGEDTRRTLWEERY